MNVALIAGIFIALAAVFGAWRTMRHRARHRVPRIALQFAAALVLYLALFPPTADEHFAAGALVVLTPGAAADQMRKPGATLVALPGVDAPSDVECVPDLGTALRRHPDTTRLAIVGGGLPARDRDAARGLAIDFEAAPPAKGIVDLDIPTSVRAGSAWTLGGRVEGDRGGRVELRDPAGAVIANATLAEDGAFALAAHAKAAGAALFSLRALDASGKDIEEIAVPVTAREGDALRAMLIAGAPDPELKYLRRWASDANVRLTSRMTLSEGVAMQDGTAALTREALTDADILIVDERSWNALDANAKSLVMDAVRGGLGLFVRVTGAVPEAVAADWGQRFGFRVQAADVAQTVSLDAGSNAADANLAFARRAIVVEGDAAAPLLKAADGSALALWRNDGQGRIALWWLADSYRLALVGDGARFGTVWSDALSTIARARGRAQPVLPGNARVDERGVVCGIAGGALVEQADGTRVALAVDAQRCAAYWPAQPGWQTLIAGGERWPFYVRSADDAKAWAAAQTSNATRLLTGSRGGSASGAATRSVPLPRWPFFLAWLAVAAVLWWLERSPPASGDAALEPQV